MHAVCDIMLRSDVLQVASVRVELPDGSRIESHQPGKLPLGIGTEKGTLRSVYCIHRFSFSIMFCSRLDQNGVNTTMKNSMYQFRDNQDGGRHFPAS